MLPSDPTDSGSNPGPEGADRPAGSRAPAAMPPAAAPPAAPDALSLLLGLHDAAKPTGSGLHPRLLAALEEREAARRRDAAQAPSGPETGAAGNVVALPGLQGRRPPPLPDKASVRAAIWRGAVAALPRNPDDARRATG